VSRANERICESIAVPNSDDVSIHVLDATYNFAADDIATVKTTRHALMLLPAVPRKPKSINTL
jgi:hypothetical protein